MGRDQPYDGFKYECGLNVPSSPVLLRLAEALDVNLDYLFRPTTIVLEPEMVHYRCRSQSGVKARKWTLRG